MSTESDEKRYFIDALYNLANADGKMSDPEDVKIEEIIERRSRRSQSTASFSMNDFCKDIMDMLGLACVDGELHEKEEKCIIDYIAAKYKSEEAKKIFDLARRMELLRLHFQHLILVACADGKFYEEEKQFLESLQKFYLLAFDEISLIIDDNEVKNHPYYKGVCVKREIFNSFVKYLRDEIKKKIEGVKVSSICKSFICGKYRKETANEPTIENIRSQYAVAETFVVDMLSLAYEDNSCSKYELRIIKAVSKDYGISKDDFATILLRVERKYQSPVQRIGQGYWDKDGKLVKFKKWLKSLYKFLISGTGRFVAILSVIIWGYFVYENIHGKEECTYPLLYLNETLSSMFRSHGGLYSEIIEAGGKLKGGVTYYLVFQLFTSVVVIILMFAYFGKEFLNGIFRRRRKICQLFKLWRNKGDKNICVIWGYSREGISLAAEMKRHIKNAAVIFMLDRDVITEDEYKDITHKLVRYGCRWKRTSFSDLRGMDGVGDYHFVISDKGRENRILAQNIIDKISANKKTFSKKFFYHDKPQIYIRIKHSNFVDLAEWLNNSIIRNHVDLRVFRDTDMLSKDFIRNVEICNENLFYERSQNDKSESSVGESVKFKNMLFLGMGTNGRAFLESLITSKRLDKKAKVTIFESNEDAIHRCVLYIKNVCHTVDWECGRPSIDNGCYEIGNRDQRQWVIRYGFLKNFYLTLDFVDKAHDIKKTVFKEWAWKDVFDDDGFKFDLVVSCLGDDHVSLTVMRRITRIWEDRHVGRNQKHFPFGKYFIQLDDMGYSVVYGRYVNKNIPVFGDYRTIFNSELIWDEKTITLASLIASCDRDKNAVIPGAVISWNKDRWEWINIRYSYQYKYILMAEVIQKLLRRNGFVIDIIQEGEIKKIVLNGTSWQKDAKKLREYVEEFVKNDELLNAIYLRRYNVGVRSGKGGIEGIAYEGIIKNEGIAYEGIIKEERPSFNPADILNSADMPTENNAKLKGFSNAGWGNFKKKTLTQHGYKPETAKGLIQKVESLGKIVALLEVLAKYVKE